MGILNLFFGAVSFPVREIASGIWRGPEDNDIVSRIIFENRLPQSITAAIAGAALGVSGLLLQTGMRNPLAGPSILGVTSGAGLGVAVILLAFDGTIALGGMTFGGNLAVIAGALVGSTAVMAVLLALSTKLKGTLTVLIVGIMTGYAANSIVSLLSSFSASKALQGYVIWGMGSFSGVTYGKLLWLAVPSAIGLVWAGLLAKRLDVMLLGDDYARNLGLNVKSTRNQLLSCAGLLAAVVTSYCGPVSFIGLAMPHIARMVFRTERHLVLIPATAFAGAITALSCNIISVASCDEVIPVNALTPLIGVPVVLSVVLKGMMPRRLKVFPMRLKPKSLSHKKC